MAGWLGYKMWETGVEGKMWGVVRTLYVNSMSYICLEGKPSESLSINHRVLKPLLSSLIPFLMVFVM